MLDTLPQLLPESPVAGFHSSDATFDNRRSAERVPYPAELEIHVGHRTVEGIVRDISIDRSIRPHRMGIAVLHHSPLPVGSPVLCLTRRPCQHFPEQFEVTFKWCRRFGDDGYVSGGLVK
ncbi:MAG: PilZ domain-containing protein [Planctomycetaceae bacterium]